MNGPSDFEEYLCELSAMNGSLIDRMIADAPQLAALVPADRMKLFAHLSTLQIPESVIQELGRELDKQRTKKTNRPQADKQPADFDAMFYQANDGGILDAWKDRHSEQWLFVTGNELWYDWQETHWNKDESRRLQLQIQKLIVEMHRQAKVELYASTADKDDTGIAIAKAMLGATKRSAQRINSVAVMAQAHRSTPATTLDAGNSLNLHNGTLNLITLELRPHSREDFFTFVLDYDFDPATTCPRFLQFLTEVLVKDDEQNTPDPDLILLFQELWGYSLTIETHHEIMAWLSGEGGNGKTVALTILCSLLGPMARSVNFHTLGQPGDYTLASLPGKRVVLSTEGQRGGYIAEDLIKRLVTGEVIPTRPIYGHPFEFQAMAKIWWAMNDRPNVRDTSSAFWRRLVLIPFNRSFENDPKKDPNLIEKLLTERSGILNWALEGLARLRVQGRFTQAEAVNTAKKNYKIDANPVQQWIEQCTQKVPVATTAGKALYGAYKAWCDANGHKALANNSFAIEIQRLGVQKDPHGRAGVAYYVEFVTPEDDQDGEA